MYLVWNEHSLPILPNCHSHPVHLCIWHLRWRCTFFWLPFARNGNIPHFHSVTSKFTNYPIHCSFTCNRITMLVQYPSTISEADKCKHKFTFSSDYQNGKPGRSCVIQQRPTFCKNMRWPTFCKKAHWSTFCKNMHWPVEIVWISLIHSMHCSSFWQDHLRDRLLLQRDATKAGFFDLLLLLLPILIPLPRSVSSGWEWLS